MVNAIDVSVASPTVIATVGFFTSSTAGSLFWHDTNANGNATSIKSRCLILIVISFSVFVIDFQPNRLQIYDEFFKVANLRIGEHKQKGPPTGSP